jgi:hypothetical protein
VKELKMLAKAQGFRELLLAAVVALVAAATVFVPPEPLAFLLLRGRAASSLIDQ